MSQTTCAIRKGHFDVIIHVCVGLNVFRSFELTARFHSGHSALRNFDGMLVPNAAALVSSTQFAFSTFVRFIKLLSPLLPSTEFHLTHYLT